MELEAKIDRLPIDLLAHIFGFFSSFTDLAQASSVCKNWKQGVKESLARKQNLSFAGWKMDDESTARLVCDAYNLKKLDMYVSVSFVMLQFYILVLLMHNIVLARTIWIGHFI
ncbi:hypothetical protein K1719_019497 [Acacia pycnantha]|nr:hypothetical protein K1719_019497 [Acacia pycnantha]